MTPRQQPVGIILLEAMLSIGALAAAYARNWPVCLFCMAAAALTVAIWTRDGG